MKIHFPLLRHAKTPYIRINTSLCEACWTCVDTCPNHVLGKVEVLSHRHVRVDRADQCEGCGKCVKVCPNGAILRVDKVKK
ncbi:MAG: ferredoxin family protein [Anaerolineae bacterium]|nr:ferredoxin family protein [Anaerolineae bacterium]